jgi:replicative DNA helicase
MSREQLVDRLIAAEAQVSFWRLRTGQLNSETDFALIQEALDRLSRMKIFIDDTPSPNIMQIRSIARRIQSENGLDLLIIDYVQLIQPLSQSENIVQQFTEISHGIKALARELNIPVLAVSQLNRQVDSREIRIPRLSDLRETGSWEQDADVVLMIYRKDRDKLEPSLEEEGATSIIIAKHRNGPMGTVDLKFDSDKVTFRPVSKTHASFE